MTLCYQLLLRLPPYHCELNPIELARTQAKRYVVRHNRTFKLAAKKESFKRRTTKTSTEYWKNAIKHVMEKERNVCELDNLIDLHAEPWIIISSNDSSTLFSNECD
ncbi:hypothetical protein Trydic_g16972 [Trypoxylus dichotomus]